MKPRWFEIVHAWLKAISIAVGFIVTVVALMAIVGALTANGWVRTLVAIVVALAVPAIIADRVRPKDDYIGGMGLPSDIFALILLGFAVLFIAVPSKGRALLLREADRETQAGAGPFAKLPY